jgi:hypothetical protein
VEAAAGTGVCAVSLIFINRAVSRSIGRDAVRMIDSSYAYVNDWPTLLIDPSGYEGKICISCSCYGKDCMLDGINLIPDLYNAGSDKGIVTPTKRPKAKPCGRTRNCYMPGPGGGINITLPVAADCYPVDAIMIDPGSSAWNDLAYDGIPAPPSGRHTVLKISNFDTCTLSCGSSGPSLSCESGWRSGLGWHDHNEYRWR